MGGHYKIACESFTLSQERALLSTSRGKFEKVMTEMLGLCLYFVQI